MTAATLQGIARKPLRARISALLRRRIAPTAGIALLLAGGSLCVRIVAATLLGDGNGPEALFTACACVLAGVSLLLIALPKFVPSLEGAADPSSSLDAEG
ncbi:MAG: hypothetical protein H6531_05940 [Actinobacteria bacterium]|nr:hypothetical protein [Thermoleophilia bacterium]MCB9011355.1 hypothetical protein [Actinomycetota bacterium]